MVGKTFNRLVVIAPTGHNARGERLWECRCQCGQLTTAKTASLNNGDKQSCGCLNQENRLRRKNATHGQSKTRLYAAWKMMLRRCQNPSNPAFRHYGARGIRVCERWRCSFVDFAADLGLRPSPRHSLDRIDNDGHYSCGKCAECLENRWSANCRWATPREQSRNTRRNHLVTIGGVTRNLIEWCEHNDLNYQTIICRIRRGWDDVRAVTTPPKRKHASHASQE